MKRVFIDVNVLVAVMNKEYPLFSDAARVLSLADRRDFDLFTSSICLAIGFYFAEKKSGTSLAKKKIKLLLDHIKVTTVDDKTIRQAVDNASIHEVEDGMQYYSALASSCTYIVTEDKDAYYFSEIKVLSCNEFLKDQATNNTK
ncbi:MAG TPA: PIN domain-containing protein [Saprospiraceae bacterium]|nr:PIN domain-containing protein [Saprospiraceae bacterium]